MPIEVFSVVRPFESHMSPCVRPLSMSVPPLPVVGKGALLDTVALDNHNRTCRSVMGKLVGNAMASNQSASSQYFGFNCNFNDVPVDNSNALHVHSEVEFFFAYSGDFEIRAGDGGHASVRLDKWDMVVIPAFVKRYFKCVASEAQTHHCREMAEHANGQCALILTGLVGEPFVQWTKETVAIARERGVLCSDGGVLLDPGAVVQDESVRELDCTQAELEACVYRAADRRTATREVGNGNISWQCVDVVPGSAAWSPEADRDYLLFTLEGEVTLEQESQTQQLVPMQVVVASSDSTWSLSVPGSQTKAAVVFVISASLAVNHPSRNRSGSPVMKKARKQLHV